MRATTVLMFLACLLLVASDSSAQIAVGDRIRVTQIGNAEVVGYFESADAARLAFKSGEGKPTMTLPLTNITKFEISRGFQRKTAKGVMIGGGVGLLLGLFFGGVAAEDTSGIIDFSAAEAVAVGGVVALAGAGLGALFGSMITEERWQRIEISELESAGQSSK